MINHRKRTLACFFIILISLVGIILFTQHKNNFKLTVQRNKTGWEYYIVSHKQKIIYQPYVPAIWGNKSFLNKKDAKKTGNLVIKKLRNGKLPIITISELDSMNINY